MMKRILIFGLFFIFSQGDLIAQKVKYKELFILLQAENFVDGERYLRIFIDNEPDHPNANYYMGVMLQQKLEGIDMLRETERYGAVADSSINYYQKSLQLITEKEVKKHDDDYYVMHSRRNKRTGKYEVSISDVHLGIEQRIKAVEQDKENSLMLKGLIKDSEQYYASGQEIYALLANSYSSSNDLCLMSDQTTEDLLADLMREYDSAVFKIEKYSGILGKSNYLTQKTIEDFPNQGLDSADFLAEPIELWDYKHWSAGLLSSINQDIIPIREKLLIHDREISDVYEQCITDSVDVRPRAFELAATYVSRDLVKYDPAPFTRMLFNYRVGELNYLSLLFLWHREVEDSVDIGYQLEFAKELDHQLGELTVLQGALSEANVEQAGKRYKMLFEDRYGGVEGMQFYLREKQVFVESQEHYMHSIIDQLNERDSRGYWQGMGIPIASGGLAMIDSLKVSFSTIHTDTLGSREYGVYGFYRHPDSTAFYSAVVPSSRTIEEVEFTPLDSVFHGVDYMRIEDEVFDLEDGGKLLVVSTNVQDDSLGLYAQTIRFNSEGVPLWNTRHTIGEMAISVLEEDGGILTVLGHGEEVLLQLDEIGQNQYVVPEVESADPGEDSTSLTMPIDTLATDSIKQ